jgi:hypothetical protein
MERDPSGLVNELSVISVDAGATGAGASGAGLQAAKQIATAIKNCLMASPLASARTESCCLSA